MRSCNPYAPAESAERIWLYSDSPAVAEVVPTKHVKVVTDAENHTHKILWTTVGMLGALLISVFIWVMLIVFFGWVGAVAIVVIPLLILLLPEFRLDRR